MEQKITQRVVEAMRPGDLVWDSELKGFGCRRRAEACYYVLKYRLGHRQRWITIGRHGSP
jgi:hypothetical protein